ncbi:MAG: electron transport complex subunit RsxC [Bacteroidales bacterium]|jgi:electron transport complex protein RnfC|nr:electron transport complex subunit RsxC [Bacteroidales bacterium]
MNTFRLGGVHPEENKLSNQSAIEIFPLPKQAIVFISQHLGAPPVPVVNKGDKVKAGQLLAKAEAFICANTHSPYCGTITKIDVAVDISGYKRPAFYIDVDESDEWEEGIDRSKTLVSEITLDKNQIIERIKDRGIVGLGGAAFPTHIKYMLPEGKKADCLIINAVECEPYLTSDYRVMIEQAEEACVGIEIMKKALGVAIAKVGIEDNKPEAIKKMKEVASKYKGIEIVSLKTKYPQGAEKQLIYALTKREVPSGKLPVEVGCVVNNIGTAVAIYNAVQKNHPLIDNILTITGKSFPKPRNLQVRVGTMLKEVIEYCGGLPQDSGKIISGGTMMGKAISVIEAPTVKTTSSILIMSEKEATRKHETNCLRCGKCAGACPMGLEPVSLFNLAKTQQWEEAEKQYAMDCIECGCCLFTCPAGKPLLDMIRVAKSNVGAIRSARVIK